MPTPSVLQKRHLENVDVSAPFRGYTKYVEKYPLAEAGLLGGAGAAAGYFGTGMLINPIIKLLLVGKSPAEKAQIMAALHQGGGVQRLKRIGGIAGGTLGAGYALNKAVDWSSLKNIFKSLKSKDYWKNNPEALKAKEDAHQKRIDKTKYKSRLKDFTWGREASSSLQKKAGEISDPFLGERVPIHYSLDLLKTDPFLTEGQKQIATSLTTGAEDRSIGMTSGEKLMKSAVRAGVGFATAYLFGKALSSVMALPPPIVKRVSVGGGIAGALLNSGIFEEF